MKMTMVNPGLKGLIKWLSLVSSDTDADAARKEYDEADRTFRDIENEIR